MKFLRQLHAQPLLLVLDLFENLLAGSGGDRLGISIERASVVIQRTGNTSSASIPLALADALDAGRIDNGDLVLLVGFGGGMTAASCVLRWGGGLE